MRGFIATIGLAGVLAIIGCGVPPAAVMSMAQTMSAAAEQQRQAAARWASDLEQADTAREARGIAAFVARIRAAGDDELKIADATQALIAALDQVRDDRWAADERLRIELASAEALDALGEQANTLAVESQTLSDEFRRYLGRAWEAYREAQALAAQKAQQKAATACQARSDLIRKLLGVEIPCPKGGIDGYNGGNAPAGAGSNQTNRPGS
jgi:hypothetical protein